MVKDQYSILGPGWQQFLRFRGLTTVQFEVHHSTVVDIRKCPDIPNESDLDYFVHREHMQPVDERYLMRLFHHPEDYEVENSDVGLGWGINLVEGFLPYKVWTLFTSLFVLVSQL